MHKIPCLPMEFNLKLEMMIVAPRHANSAFDYTACGDCSQYTIVTLDQVESVAQANAAGVQFWTAPTRDFIEEHAYPEPEWAEALIEVHQKSWAALGHVVGNANPNNLMSWADDIITYGQ